MTIPPSNPLEKLIWTHRTVHGFLGDKPCCDMVLETLGQVEVGVRALGWRLTISSAPTGNIRVHITTASGVEIAAEGPSLIACLLEPGTSGHITDHYKAAITARLQGN